MLAVGPVHHSLSFRAFVEIRIEAVFCAGEACGREGVVLDLYVCRKWLYGTVQFGLLALSTL